MQANQTLPMEMNSNTFFFNPRVSQHWIREPEAGSVSRPHFAIFGWTPKPCKRWFLLQPGHSSAPRTTPWHPRTCGAASTQPAAELFALDQTTTEQRGVFHCCWRSGIMQGQHYLANHSNINGTFYPLHACWDFFGALIFQYLLFIHPSMLNNQSEVPVMRSSSWDVCG